MDLFLLTLQAHLVGAFTLAGLLIATVGTLLHVKTQIKTFKILAALVAVVAAMEIATGTALYLLAGEGGLMAFCGKMAIYLSVTAIAEFALFQKIRYATT